MTTCDKIRPRLTAYLDGDLADDHGSVVRGHLRECAACREVASDEAALRDGLRLLPPLDPPASLWAGVQARLAAAEVADARKPPWRRLAERGAQWARGARWAPTMSQLGAAACVAAAAIAVITWRGSLRGRGDELSAGRGTAPPTLRAPAPDLLPLPPSGPSPQLALAAPAPAAPSADDVTAELAAEPARTTASYDRTVGELMTLIEQARPRWSNDDRVAFDARVAGMRDAVARGGQARSVQRAQRSLIRYLQGAVVRDDTLLASGGAQ